MKTIIKKTKWLAMSGALLFAVQAAANNLVVTNVTLAPALPFIYFDFGWDNSWRVSSGPANYDGIWVFVKYQDCSNFFWAHAAVSTVNGDHVLSGGSSGALTVDAVNGSGKGIFIHRSGLGSGSILTTTRCTLKLTNPVAGTYNYQVHAIEMVKIPSGNFYVGDATGASTFLSVQVTTTEESAGWGAGWIFGGYPIIGAGYPAGYSEIWCMKYEVTQEQYKAFLNDLTYDQQTAHTAFAPNSAAGTCAMVAACAGTRNGIKVKTPGVNNTTPAIYGCDLNNNGTQDEATGDGQTDVCGYLNWNDLSAYLDWSCLRPMSETEYEKISRGTLNRVAGEYAWGDAVSLSVACGAIVNSGSTNESTANVGANGFSNYNSACAGPLRAGIAATATSTRVTAGSTYYGVMEMSGSVWERAVTANNTTFDGQLGDGDIAPVTGIHNVANWPAAATASGVGQRGGGYASTNLRIRISDRNDAAVTDATRVASFGGRGVR